MITTKFRLERSLVFRPTKRPKRNLLSTLLQLPFKEPIHILGGGSIGMLIAASIRITYPSYPVQILLRNATNIVNKQTTICLLQKRQPRIVHVPAATTLPVNHANKIKNLILTTKAFQAKDAIQSIQERITDQTKLFILCNGALGVREELANYPGPIHLGTVTHGVYREPSEDFYTIRHAGVGQVFVDHEPMADLFDQVNLNCQYSIDMERILWYKLAANAVCNPLTAIHQCTNGELYKINDFNSIMTSILEEIVQVYKITSGREMDLQTIKDFVTKVIDDNLSNQSSMQQDVFYQRKTEIDYINGYIVRKAQAHGIECPVNRSLTENIKSIEESWNDKTK